MTSNVPHDIPKESKEKKDSPFKPILQFLGIIAIAILWYFIYDFFFQLKVQTIQVSTYAKDSIFEVNENVRFYVNIITNGKNGKIKYYLVDAERGDYDKKLFENTLNTTDTNKSYTFLTGLTAFDGGYHRVCLKYTIETNGIFKFIDDILKLKMPSADQIIEGLGGNCFFSCMPKDWGDVFENQYSLFIEPRVVAGKYLETKNSSPTKLFYIMRYEVSSQKYEEWARKKGLNIYQSDIIPSIVETSKVIDSPIYPALMVTWDDAEKYCEGLKGRLPTISEWNLLKEIAITFSTSEDQIIDLNLLKEDSNNLYGLNTNAVEWSYDSCPKDKSKRKTYGWGSFNQEPYKTECLQTKTPYHKVGFRCIIPRDSMWNNLKTFLN